MTNPGSASITGDASLLAAIERVEKLALTDLHGALAAAPALMEQADALGSGALRVRARRAWGQALAYANRYDESLLAFAGAIQVAQQTDEPVEGALARNTSVHALCRLGRFDEAVIAGQLAQEEFLSHGRPDLAARACVNTAVAHRMADRPTEAIGLFEQAIPAFAGQPVVEAQVSSNLAEALLDVGRFEEAKEAFGVALASFTRAGAARAAAIVQGNLGDLAGRQGHLHTAIEFFERARRALDDAGAPGDAARLRVEQADALSALGMLSGAAAAYHSALGALRSSGLAAEVARAALGLGSTLVRMGRVGEGKERLLEAAHAFGALEHETGRARVGVHLAHVEMIEGDLAAAEVLLSEATAGLRQRPGELAAALVLWSMVKRARGDDPGAEACAREALGVAEEGGLPQLVAHSLLALSAALRALGRLSEGLNALRRAAVQVERLRGALQSGRFRSAFLGDRERVFLDAAGMALELAEAQGGDGPLTGEAFSFVEQARSRSLLESLGQGDRQEAVSGALSNATEHPRDEVGLMRSLGEHRAALSALYDRLDGTGVPVSPGRVSEWRERIHARESAIETIEQRLAATDRFAGLFSQPAGIQRVQACLHAGEVLVEYFLEGTLLSAFVLRSGGVEVRRGMAAMDDVTSTLAELSFQVARAIARGLPGGDAGDRLTRDARGVLARLHGLLMAPIATCVAGAERIIVVPFGPLFAVPFSALVGPDGREVVEICETSVVPSASVFEHLRVRSRSASPEGRFGHGALVMGVSDVAAPDANAEAAQVAVVVPEARLFVGAGATREVFVREAPGSTLVHLATHARFLANDPSASGIRLADGWLTTHDLAGLRLNGATVVLSACDTGRTTVGAGEEILGLARALFLAGASTLVMSLWPVHDESTRHLMACLHSARYVQGANWPLAARVSVPCATALRSAQRTVRLQRAHPAAWAPFFCIGIP